MGRQGSPLHLACSKLLTEGGTQVTVVIDGDSQENQSIGHLSAKHTSSDRLANFNRACGNRQTAPSNNGVFLSVSLVADPVSSLAHYQQSLLPSLTGPRLHRERREKRTAFSFFSPSMSLPNREKSAQGKLKNQQNRNSCQPSWVIHFRL